jgi:hypothetical protein
MASNKRGIKTTREILAYLKDQRSQYKIAMLSEWNGPGHTTKFERLRQIFDRLSEHIEVLKVEFNSLPKKN